MKTVSFSRIVVFLSSLLILCATSAAGAAYPNKPIRLIVPFSAGGNTDIFARTIAPIISEQWGQQVVVDNRGGAGGVIGTAIAAHATPDGYTLLFVSGSHVVNPSVRKNLPYDTIKDFQPISLVIVVPNLLVAYPSVPVRSIPELIKLAKARPGKLNYASSGTGTFAHLSFATFNSMAGVQIQHIPYKGNGPATVAILGGQVQFMMGAQPSAMPHVRAKRLIALGVTSTKRSPQLPEVPAISEFLPGYEFTQGFGILAPAGTPQSIVNKLNKEIVAVLNMPEVRKSFLDKGATPTSNSPGEYAKYIRSEIKKLAKVAKDVGL